MSLLLLSIGIIIGILLSMIAFVVGKRLEVRINAPSTPRPSVKKAVIIKNEPDPFMDELNADN